MSSGRPFLDLARWTAECVSVDFNYFGQFCIFEEPWNFSSPQAGLASFLLHFSNSATCQTMPVGSCPISCHAREAHTIFLAWKGLLGNCPGPWAVAAVDI